MGFWEFGVFFQCWTVLKLRIDKYKKFRIDDYEKIQRFSPKLIFSPFKISITHTFTT